MRRSSGARGLLAVLAAIIWVAAFFNVLGEHAAAANVAAVLLLLATHVRPRTSGEVEPDV